MLGRPILGSLRLASEPSSLEDFVPEILLQPSQPVGRGQSFIRTVKHSRDLVVGLGAA